ncbi:CCCH zinc finger DNA binding protein [Talaromyces islandicus]|uniref:CCCH zinc finger DNA binding protein n=1 Tax=Talaromyces islandicus TaxID=28573 RepID=A0A0U1LLF6_TALIS|nr:CCCH zinc finger DNA binding protein [Talaromyces islandicus]
MCDIDDVKRRHADACAVQVCKDKIITELCEYIEALKLEIQETKEAVNDQKRLVASFKEENKRNGYVSVLVDGDGMNFHEKLIQDGQNGGYEAARLLIKAVEDHFQKCDTKLPPNILYKIRVYSNVEGLTKAYRDANVLPVGETLTPFIQAFNKANTLCDIVDAGNGKECADVKLKAHNTENTQLTASNLAHFEQDILDVHCLRVVFCASADNGYARVLGPYRDSKRITLVKGPPFAHEMEELAADFETTSFESVFMSNKLKSRRVSFSTTNTCITPPRTPTPNYASAAKKSPPLQSSSLTVNSTTPNGVNMRLPVFKNASGQRVDSPLRYSSKENVDQLKRRKLCNQFHLLESCPFGNYCTHTHGSALSLQQLADLRFPASMHGVDTDTVTH